MNLRIWDLGDHTRIWLRLSDDRLDSFSYSWSYFKKENKYLYHLSIQFCDLFWYEITKSLPKIHQIPSIFHIPTCGYLKCDEQKVDQIRWNISLSSPLSGTTAAFKSSEN